MEALTGLNPFVVIVLAGIAAYAGWPYAQQYLPLIQAMLTRPAQPRQVELAVETVEQPQSSAVPPAVLHLVALDQQLESAGVSAAERAALVDPLWPKVVRRSQ